ncbi:hypothetical protein Droror1_Dr00024432 [Drosera rotundifolia]
MNDGKLIFVGKTPNVYRNYEPANGVEAVVKKDPPLVSSKGIASPVTLVGGDERRSYAEVTFTARKDKEVKTEIEISVDEVAEACKYWSCSLIGFVLGERVPRSSKCLLWGQKRYHCQKRVSVVQKWAPKPVIDVAEITKPETKGKF